MGTSVRRAAVDTGETPGEHGQRFPVRMWRLGRLTAGPDRRFWKLRSSPAILKDNCRRPSVIRVCAAAPSKNLKRRSSTMAVPKRRMSRSNTRSRRAQWKTEATGLVNVNVAGQQHKVPRRLLKAARLGLVDLDRR
jgi:large subunit ribosomal protein L32